jgi:hypothetical protein
MISGADRSDCLLAYELSAGPAAPFPNLFPQSFTFCTNTPGLRQPYILTAHRHKMPQHIVDKGKNDLLHWQ